MAMGSSTRFLVAFAGFLALLTACGDTPLPVQDQGLDSPRTAAVSGTASPSTDRALDILGPDCPVQWVETGRVAAKEGSKLDLSAPVQAKIHTDTAGDADGWLPGGSHDHPGYSPVGAFGDGGLLLHDNQTRGEDNHYFSWHPGDAPQPVWAVAEDLQDIPAEGTGSNVVTVRHGFAAPFAVWRLIVHNDNAGGGCLLSQSDLSAYSREMMQLGFPGLAPTPSLEGDLIVWSERFLSPDGQRHKRVVLYNLASFEMRTLAEIDNVNDSDLWSASISGNTVSWLDQPPNGQPTVQVLRSLTEGTESRSVLSQRPKMSALLDRGTYLALSLEDRQVAVDLRDGSSVKVADFGAWIYSSGRYMSWAAATGRVGYYDAREKTVHLIDTKGAETVDAYVLGKYFIWQEFRNVPAPNRPSGETRRESRFYAVRLPD